MVERNQFLERPAIIKCGELALEGHYHRASRPEKLPVAICAPHPRMGGNMDIPLVWEIAFNCFRDGHATLRFNYRGVGASQGRYADGIGEQDDLKAAIDLLLQTEGGAGALVAGYSFGSYVAAQVAAADSRVAGLVLVAPPLAMFDFAALERVPCPWVIVAGQDDQYTNPGQAQEWCAGRGLEPEIIAIPRADHFFMRGFAEAAREVTGFFARFDRAPASG